MDRTWGKGKEIRGRAAELLMAAVGRPAVLVASHGAFAWGDSSATAVEHAAALEEIAQVAFNTVLLSASAVPITAALHERHFRRKHGATAYYGQVGR